MPTVLDAKPVNRISRFFDDAMVSPWPFPSGWTNNLDVTDNLNPIRSPIRSPIRGPFDGVGGGASVPDTITAITTSASTTPSAQAGNHLVLGPDHDAVMVWVGDFARTTFRYDLYVNDGTSTSDPIRLMPFQCVVINAAAGQTISFGCAIRTGSAISTTPTAVSIQAAPFKRPESLVDPSGFTGNLITHKAGPCAWVDQSVNLTLSDYDQEFIVGAASGDRHIFVAEIDDASGVSLVRSIWINNNEPTKIRCHYPRVSVASYDGLTLAITAPTGSAISSAVDYRPPFTVISTTNVSTPAEFQTAFAAATDGLDIVITASSLDLSGGGQPINPTNYATGMARNVRIRSTSGNPANCTITGASVFISIANGKKLIVEGVHWDIDGYAAQSGAGGIFHLAGNVEIHNCTGAGPGPGSEPTVAMTDVGGFSALVKFTFGTFSNSGEDLIDTTGSNCRLQLIGMVLDGNGSETNHQILTSHTGSVIEAWGSQFKDSTRSGNLTRISADTNTASRIHLLFCKSLAADIAFADGIEVKGVDTIYGCVFEKLSQLTPSISTTGHVVFWAGSNLTRVVAANVAFMVFGTAANIYSLIVGNNVQMGATVPGYPLDARLTIESYGNLYQSAATSGGTAARLSVTAVGTGNTVYSTNDQFIAVSSQNMIDIGTSAELSVHLQNSIFSGTTVATVGATGSACSARGNYMTRSASPTNWTTRMSIADSGNTFSTNAPGLGADGTPTAGNCDNEGENPGWLGGMDRRRRILHHGGSWVRGPVERAEIKSGAKLFPVVRI